MVIRVEHLGSDRRPKAIMLEGICARLVFLQVYVSLILIHR